MAGDDTNVHKHFDADDGGDAEKNAVNALIPEPVVEAVGALEELYDTHRPHVHDVSQRTDLCSVYHGDGDNKDPSSDDGDDGPSWQQHNRTLDYVEGEFVSIADGDTQWMLLRRRRPQLRLPPWLTKSSRWMVPLRCWEHDLPSHPPI